MFNSMDKIIKKGKEKVSETEEEVAKALFEIEMKEAEFQEDLKALFITSATIVEFNNKREKVLLICVPYRSKDTLRKVHSLLVTNLQAKFQCPVIFVANRIIISKNAPIHKTQKRPRSRTLMAVHEAILDDILYPNQISGLRIRVKVDGTKIFKIFLGENLREKVENKLSAFAHIYKKLTSKQITFDFVPVPVITKDKK